MRLKTSFLYQNVALSLSVLLAALCGDVSQAQAHAALSAGFSIGHTESVQGPAYAMHGRAITARSQLFGNAGSPRQLMRLAQNASAVSSDAQSSGTRVLPAIEIRAAKLRAARRQAASRLNTRVPERIVQPRPSGGPAAVDGKSAMGGRLTGYSAGAAPSTLKTDTPILQTPMSVQVVTRQTMDDQKAVGLKEAVTANVSGTTLAPSFFDVFKIRGFNTFGGTYKNGLQEYAVRHLDITNLQSIEVLKGPAAMLFGRMEPGGIVNLVVKRPLETPYNSLEQQIGSFGFARTAIDSTGPLNTSKTLLYRFNGEFYQSNSYRDFVNDRNVFLAPTLTLRPSDRFRLNIDVEYQRRTWVDDYPLLPAVGTGPAPIPISRYLSQPSVTTRMPDRMEKKRIAYDWTYDIAPEWSLTNRLSYAVYDYETVNALGTNFNAATGMLSRAMTVIPGYTNNVFATNFDLKGKFATGALKHAVLVGYDYFNYTSPLYTAYFPIISPINIYAPLYWQNEAIYRNPSYVKSGQSWAGVYTQDTISLFDDKVHVVLGGRYDWAEVASNKNRTSPSLALATYTPQYDEAFSPRIGLVFQPQPWMSIYGSFTRSFGANNTTRLGQPLPPQRGEQFEAGVKAELFDKRLTASAAYFDIAKTNMPLPDPLNPLNTILVGQVSSRGVEIDLTGRLNRNWSVIANYTHDDVRSVNGPNAGKTLPASPLNYGNVWLKYDADGALRGWSVGGGLAAYESAYGDAANTFMLPGYTLLNGMVAYTTKISGATVTGQINVRNITNVAYYPTSLDRFTITTGAPRAFMGSLRVEF